MIFGWFAANPAILLFFVVGGAVLIGKFTVKGYGLGMVAAAIVVGAGISAWASTYGVKMGLDNFAKSLFYYLFMYGVGLRVGPRSSTAWATASSSLSSRCSARSWA